MKSEAKKSLKSWLLAQAGKDYKEFSAGLIPGCDNMLGVRIPVLRTKAKELAKENWRSFVLESEDEFFEETMIAGMVIGYAKADIREKIEVIREFIPRICNWSVNDSFCSTIKLKPAEREIFWDFLMEYKDSNAEFEVRVVAVMLMNQYLLPEYIEKTVKTLDYLYDGDYYGSMGIAWALATAYAKFPEVTMGLLKGANHLSDETYNRAIQKMLESYRVAEEDKVVLRGMKRRAK